MSSRSNNVQQSQMMSSINFSTSPIAKHNNSATRSNNFWKRQRNRHGRKRLQQSSRFVDPIMIRPPIQKSHLSQLIENGKLNLCPITTGQDIFKHTQISGGETISILSKIDEEETIHYSLHEILKICPDLWKAIRKACIFADTPQRIGEKCETSEITCPSKWRVFLVEDYQSLDEDIKIYSSPFNLRLSTAYTYIKKMPIPASSLMFPDGIPKCDTLFRKTLILKLRPSEKILNIPIDRIAFIIHAYQYGKYAPDTRPVHPSGLVYSSESNDDFDYSRHIKFDPWIFDSNNSLSTISQNQDQTSSMLSDPEFSNSTSQCVICLIKPSTQRTRAMCSHLAYCDDCFEGGKNFEIRDCFIASCYDESCSKIHVSCPICRSS